MKQFNLSFLFVLLCLFLTACPSTTSESPNPAGPDADTKAFEIEAVTTPLGNWTELDLVTEFGNSLFISLNKVPHVSFDKGKTWITLNTDAIGNILEFAWRDTKSAFALTAKKGLVGFDFNDTTVWYLDNEPSWKNWAVAPDGTLYAVNQTIDEGKLQIGDEVATVTLHKLKEFRSQTAEVWESEVLPQQAFSARTYKPSIHFSAAGDTYVASYFGLQKQATGQTDWQSLPVIPNVKGALSYADVNIFVSKEESIFVHFNTVFVSRNQGASYEELSQYPDRTNFQDVYQSKDSALRFVSSPSFSTDQGKTWQTAFDLERYTLSTTVDQIFYAADQYFIAFRFLAVFNSEKPTEHLQVFNPLPDNVFNERHWGDTNVILPTRTNDYLSLWKKSLVRFNSENQVWQFEKEGLYSYFDRLSDGRFVIKDAEGLIYSADDGKTWSEPAAINADGFLEAAIQPSKILLQNDSSLVMTALYPLDSRNCKILPLMQSKDNGVTWQAIQIDARDNDGNPMNSSFGSVELSSMDNDGVLFGIYKRPSPNEFQCLYETIATARSLDDGNSWKSNASLQPFATSRQNSLVSFQGNGKTEELYVFKQGASAWQSLGKATISGEFNPIDLYITEFMYVNPLSNENKLFLVHKGQGYQSTKSID